MYCSFVVPFSFFLIFFLGRSRMATMTGKKRPTPVAALLLPSSSSSAQRRFWNGLTVFTILTALICIIAFTQMSPWSSAFDPNARRSFYYTPVVITGNPKIAFLYLVRRDIPLDFLWHVFFRNGDADKFSIYVHSAPGFVFDESTTRSHYFYDRQLKQSVQVMWGEASMIVAEKLLIKAALEDHLNQRFVLLSDSCIPLYNFTYIYNYVMSSPKSFVDSFFDAKDERYNPEMYPIISKEKWRKGSQWMTLTRKHAAAVIFDSAIFHVFEEQCKCLPEDNEKIENEGKNQTLPERRPDCIPDEHYVQTLFSTYELEDELERRTLTYTSWNQTKDKKNKQGWHPFMFEFYDANPEQMRKIKVANHVYYETEFRIEWCQNNSTNVPCFLFARKFSKGAAMRLMKDGLVGPYDSKQILLSRLMGG